MQTRFQIISDTHMQHRKLSGLTGDLLIHCGDMFNLSEPADSGVADIETWFAEQDFQTILYTGGNHDRALQSRLLNNPQPLDHAHLLVDEEFEYRGLRIYGAPWVPNLPNHAFFAPDHILAEKWAKIPSGIDILITHTPPHGILDRSSNGSFYGCPLLAAEIKRIRPRVHCFGHVHASAGEVIIDNTRFINGCSIHSRNGGVRAPVTFDMLPLD